MYRSAVNRRLSAASTTCTNASVSLPASYNLAILNHPSMQYHQFMIHCHRPYISKHYIQPQPPQGPGPNHARRMCIESALSIVKVLNIYEQAYGFHKANVQTISFIFSAALILIFTTVPTKSQPHSQDLLTHLSTCFRALDEMSSCFENARRTSAFLGNLQRQWQSRRQNRVVRGGDVGKHSVHHGCDASLLRKMDWPASSTHEGFGSEHESNYGQRIVPNLGTGVDGFEHEFEYSPIADAPSSSNVDFMDPDLCNILLSEGIPRAFI